VDGAANCGHHFGRNFTEVVCGFGMVGGLHEDLAFRVSTTYPRTARH
jgi:hypothetical protein